MMYKIRPFVTIEILLLLHHTLVYPHLTYGVELWGSADPTHINKILILQKRIIRMITSSDRRQLNYQLPASNPLFSQLKILKIQDLNIFLLLKFVFKCLNKNAPTNFHDWFKLTSNIHNYRTRGTYDSNDLTRNTKKLYIPFARTTHYGFKKIKFLGPKLWNMIPPSVRLKPSLEQFLNSLKIHLLSKYENS